MFWICFDIYTYQKGQNLLNIFLRVKIMKPKDSVKNHRWGYLYVVQDQGMRGN